MTLGAIEQSLPNGLHDAVMTALRLDYLTKVAVVELNIDVVPPDGGTSVPAYRPVRLIFEGVEVIIVDPPGVGSAGVAESRISIGEGQPTGGVIELPRLSPDTLLCWIFVERLNSFIRIASREVELEWV